jgi:hypothetical protein
MAKGDRNVAKEQFWREAVSRQASSGLHVRAFCLQEQLTESAFYAWRRTIRERDDRTKSALAVPQFVPAVITSDLASDAFTLELAGGHLLRMPGISVERLADLIAALARRLPR